MKKEKKIKTPPLIQRLQQLKIKVQKLLKYQKQQQKEHKNENHTTYKLF